MRHGDQTKIAKQAGISDGFISLLLSGQKRPSWKTAKKLAEATGTDPELWLEGTPHQIREALSQTAAA